MKKKHEIIDKLWEYVHGEADSATKVAIDKAASEDKEMRNELDSIKTLDKNLSRLVPLLQLNEEELENRVMAAIEDTPTVRAPRTRTRQPRVIFHSFRSILATPWLQSGSLVAAAATLLLLFSMYHYASAPVRWTEPEIIPLQYRGVTVDPEHAAAYTAEQLTECAASVQAAIDKARVTGRGQKWTMSCRIKELPNQVLCIQIQAYKAEQLVRQWTHYYDNLEEFKADLNTMGTKTISDLMSLAAGNTR